MTTITIIVPVEPIVEPTAPTTTIDFDKEDTCYICDSDVVYWECHYCERPICSNHRIKLPHWCELELDACPKCYAKNRGEI